MNRPGRWVFLLYLATGIFALRSSAPALGSDANASVSIPESGSNVDAFVPKGYKIFTRVDGDLNGDGLPDVALGLERDDESAMLYDRPLIILFKRPDGSYRLSARSDNAIITASGEHGDDFSGMELKGKALVLSESVPGATAGGSSKDFYRYQDGDWYLIGTSEDDYDNENSLGCPGAKLNTDEACEESSVSKNFNTWMEVDRYSIGHPRDPDDHAHDVVIRRSLPHKPMHKLSDTPPGGFADQ
jgi:hypothetical protein